MRAGAFWVAVAAACVIFADSAAPAFAAGSSSAEIKRLSKDDIEQRRQAMLVEMLNRPDDLDLAFEYAQLSESVGDLEGAVSTLERMLIYAPDTPTIQLQLGILYYRLGAYDVSRSYLQQTLANPKTPPDVARQVNLYLEQLDITAEPPPFSAQIFTAMRWESNANSGPANRTVTLNGLDFTIDDQSAGQPDWSNLTIGTLHYSYDLKRQGDQWEFDFLSYDSHHFELTDVDLDFFEVATGPSFNMKRWGMDKSRLYLYAIGDISLLGGDYYFGAPGAGIRVFSTAAERSLLDTRLETRFRDFEDSNRLPTNSDWDGAQTRVATTYSYFLSPGLVMTVQVQAQRENASADYYANTQVALSGGVSWTFANPVRAAAQYPWTLQVGAGGILRDYDQPDYTISTDEEQDETFWGRTALILPVSATIALVPQVEYRNQNSNYDIRKFDDFSALLGVQKRF